MDKDKARIISEYLLGTWVLTAEDEADPVITAAEIWRGQSLGLGDPFVAEGISVTVYDLQAYLEKEREKNE